MISAESLALQCERELAESLQRDRDTRRHVARRVAEAFRSAAPQESDFYGGSGYGYGLAGRDKLERTLALALEAEAAICRPQIASGTHALACALFGVLRPGDTVLVATGEPYDTLAAVFGLREATGSLREFGVRTRVLPFEEGSRADTLETAAKAERARLVFVQRSRGYASRPPLDQAAIEHLVVAAHRAGSVVLVDNCYGTFVGEREPTASGADLIVGSLMKNAGGGLSLTGGYVAGKQELVDMAATRLTAPGIGAEVGPWVHGLRDAFLGLYLAPHVVGQALQTARLAAALFAALGYDVLPAPDARRSDIVQAIALQSPERLLTFCRKLQALSPIDSQAVPEPWAMPGYEDAVVMAAGTFVQGATLELSADAPMRPPYRVYLQGGLAYEHSREILIALAETIGPAS